MEAGVRCEVRLDVRVAVGGALDLVARVVDGTGHEASLVVAEILPDGGPEEVVVLGIVTGAGVSRTREVAGEDLFFKAIESVGDSLEILQIGHCAGDGRIWSARGEDGARRR